MLTITYMSVNRYRLTDIGGITLRRQHLLQASPACICCRVIAQQPPAPTHQTHSWRR